MQLAVEASRLYEVEDSCVMGTLQCTELFIQGKVITATGRGSQ
jgi:hypothetical protein